MQVLPLAGLLALHGTASRKVQALTALTLGSITLVASVMLLVDLTELHVTFVVATPPVCALVAGAAAAWGLRRPR